MKAEVQTERILQMARTKVEEAQRQNGHFLQASRLHVIVSLLRIGTLNVVSFDELLHFLYDGLVLARECREVSIHRDDASAEADVR